MGEPIRKTAARDDILRDIRQTQINAVARGGVAADLADQRIAPVMLIIDSLTLQLQAANFVAAPLIAALAAPDARADKTVGKVSDDIWNDVGRPASDAALDLLIPGGNAFYVDGAVTRRLSPLRLASRRTWRHLDERRPVQRRESRTSVDRARARPSAGMSEQEVTPYEHLGLL